MKPDAGPAERQLVAGAFLEVRDCWPPDRVVADPDLNRVFESAYRRLGGARPISECNHILLNLRKAGHLVGLKSKRTSFPNRDEYEFASEIAIRFLERRDGVTLDDVICDRQLAAEFDELASRLAPGFSSLQYRWAALSLRKSRGLPPETLPRVVQFTDVRQFEAAKLKTDDLPSSPGLYMLYAGARYLYAGETHSLRSRLRKHLDHSDNRGLARWLWENPNATLFVEIQVLPPDTTTKVRKAMELELIRSRKPEFNVQR